MTLYSKLTLQALKYPGDPVAAWAKAIDDLAEIGQGTSITRAKGCPRSAFVSLAANGYILGFQSSSSGNLTANADYALKGYELLQSNPRLRDRKGDFWLAVAKEKNTSRKGQNGVLDVLLVLVDKGVFKPSAQE